MKLTLTLKLNYPFHSFGKLYKIYASISIRIKNLNNVRERLRIQNVANARYYQYTVTSLMVSWTGSWIYKCKYNSTNLGK